MRRHLANTHGIIEILRPSRYVNSRRPYSLFIDGIEVESIKDGESIAFSVESGDHTVQARIDWLRSNLLNVHVASSRTVLLEVSCPSFRYWDFLLVLGICFVGVVFGSVIAGKVGAAIGSAMGWLVYGHSAFRPRIRQTEV